MMRYYVRCKTTKPIVEKLPPGHSLVAIPLAPLPLSSSQTLKPGDMVISMSRGKSPVLHIIQKQTPTSAEILSLHYQYLELRTRVNNRLEILGVVTIGDLVKKTRKELLALPYFGVASLREVVRSLERYHLRLLA